MCVYVCGQRLQHSLQYLSMSASRPVCAHVCEGMSVWDCADTHTHMCVCVTLHVQAHGTERVCMCVALNVCVTLHVQAHGTERVCMCVALSM